MGKEKKQGQKSIKRGVQRITALLLMTIMLFSSAVRVEAAYNYYSSYSFSTGALWWAKDYKVKVYKNSSSFYTIYYGPTTVSTGFEYKPNYKEPIVISQTSSMSLGSQTVSSMNAEIDLSAFKVPAKVGGSLEKTSSASWGVANTISRTVSADDPVGYYSYNVLMNTMKLRLDLYEDGSFEDDVYIYAPTSEAYRAIVYSTNGNYYNATKYY